MLVTSKLDFVYAAVISFSEFPILSRVITDSTGTTMMTHDDSQVLTLPPFFFHHRKPSRGARHAVVAQLLGAI
jgi:ketopantoate hydroxymethyltransferase